MKKAKIGVIIHRNLAEKIIHPEDEKRLNQLGEVTWASSPTPLKMEQALPLLTDCVVGVGSWQTPWPNAEMVEACPKLKLWVHAAGSVKHMFGPHLKKTGLQIASCAPAIAETVAEYSLGAMILGIHRVFENMAANRGGQVPPPPNVKTLFRSTVGVIGASMVGRNVLRLLQPFQSKVLLYDPFVSPKEAKKLGATLVKDLVDLCAQSQVVTLHAPALPSTEKMLGAREFQAMKDDTVFVNTARGACVDEEALITELKRGRLLAIIDVTNPEPAAADNPLRKLGNVVLTSHIAGGPDSRIGRQVADDIDAFLHGRQPRLIVREEMLAKMA